MLREGWAEYTWRWLRENLRGRTQRSIVCRARRLKLGKRLQGFVSAQEGRRITGLSEEGFEWMLLLEGVAHLKVRGGDTDLRAFDPDRLVEATRNYLRRETVTEAAERLGVSQPSLLRAVQHAKADQPPGRYRTFLLPAEFDTAWATWVLRKVETRQRTTAALIASTYERRRHLSKE